MPSGFFLRECARSSHSPFQPFANPAKDAVLVRTRAKLRSNLPEWYDPHRSIVNRGNHEQKRKAGPPADRKETRFLDVTESLRWGTR